MHGSTSPNKEAKERQFLHHTHRILNMHSMHTTIALVIILIAMSAAAAAAAAVPRQPAPDCPQKCGVIDVPYPFGIGEGCFLEENYNLTCNETGLFRSDSIQITNISLHNHELVMAMYVSRDCYDESGKQVANNRPYLKWARFTISSTENKFVAVGCDTFAFLRTYPNSSQKSSPLYSTGCMSSCNSMEDVNNGSCLGVGCCQVDIPQRTKYMEFQAFSFSNHSRVKGFNNCSYAFIAKRESFVFDSSYLSQLPFSMSHMVVDWVIGNQTCEEAREDGSYQCRENSVCNNSANGLGYQCNCAHGYEGNPYIQGGCEDVDECNNTALNNCWKSAKCLNKNGSYECICPKGHTGDGKEDGLRCSPKARNLIVALGVSIGCIALLLCIACLYLALKQRRLIKLREKYFQGNGGHILLQRLSTQEGSSKITQIFSEEELKNATNNFDDNLIVGRGGFGTVYKGTLADNRIVAIKRSKLIDQSQVEQFINEIVVLSHISHRNVVQLLGCCLETEVPLLVYEFINNGTLFDHIHNPNKTLVISWETRLRIAAETAEALSYLHSAAATPIIHRDVKATNILLDENYAPKVSDFGASRLVPLDQTELATMVQGTLGYLDPEYMQTSQLTEKSDVYSFGVVLVELMTGQKALSFEKPQEERCLAAYFLSCLKEDGLFKVIESGLVHEGNKKMLEEVAILAARCLRVKGEERPSMKEVAMELEGMRRRDEKHPWVSVHLNSEERVHLLQEMAVGSEYGDSSYINSAYGNLRDHVVTVR